MCITLSAGSVQWASSTSFWKAAVAKEKCNGHTKFSVRIIHVLILSVCRWWWPARGWWSIWEERRKGEEQKECLEFVVTSSTLTYPSSPSRLSSMWEICVRALKCMHVVIALISRNIAGVLIWWWLHFLALKQIQFNLFFFHVWALFL